MLLGKCLKLVFRFLIKESLKIISKLIFVLIIILLQILKLLVFILVSIYMLIMCAIPKKPKNVISDALINKIQQITQTNDNKLCLFLDLDHTLVHCSLTKPSSRSYTKIKVKDAGQHQFYYLMIRPGATNFIKHMSKYFRIIIITNSLQSYADEIISRVDRESLVWKIYYRQDLKKIRGGFLKSVSSMGYDEAKFVVIDDRGDVVEDKGNLIHIKAFGVEGEAIGEVDGEL